MDMSVKLIRFFLCVCVCMCDYNEDRLSSYISFLIYFFLIITKVSRSHSTSSQEMYYIICFMCLYIRFLFILLIENYLKILINNLLFFCRERQRRGRILPKKCG